MILILWMNFWGVFYSLIGQVVWFFPTRWQQCTSTSSRSHSYSLCWPESLDNFVFPPSRSFEWSFPVSHIALDNCTGHSLSMNLVTFPARWNFWTRYSEIMPFIQPSQPMTSLRVCSHKDNPNMYLYIPLCHYKSVLPSFVVGFVSLDE